MEGIFSQLYIGYSIYLFLLLCLWLICIMPTFSLYHSFWQDLETYANCYTGLAKLQRLIFIADRCPQLRVEALRMAIHYVQTTYNVNLYTQLHRKLQEAVR